ncbi:winged helix DNA-binding domain-containing protein [Kribbella albertanoniae]|uniref:Winged helix DNA-binding domain-containing protein n=1 Tax=Kribbella albertanoniae TaxID=1266829 RepID=A0A4R4P1P9_9ACTN|nr:winged helix DNA-binding domain-containing protein [Kribbella albertanoniae]TDC14487.1 winged helix DNA-binding domain-containing protein [Kribbella albertanoniae]
MLKISDAERRRRLVVRHGLVRRFDRIEDAVRGMTVLHATEAATVHLSLWARVAGVTVDAVDRALYDERSVVKQLAMRRTLFVFPRDLLPAALGSAARRVAGQQRAQLTKSLTATGITEPEAWIDEAVAAVLDLLADGTARTAREIREQVPLLDSKIQSGGPSGKWSAVLPVAPVVMTLLGAEGRAVRGANAGHWRLNKPAWTSAEHWLGGIPEPLEESAAYAVLVRRWLATFGPGTEADIVWWLGATKTAVRRALADVEAVEVELDQGIGWVLPDDTQPPDEVEPWAALLPTLDPTVMGWKERDFYLDPADKPFLFDTNGNAGNTAWWDGRIVGCWLQDDKDPAAPVRLVIHDDVGKAAHAALEAEAERLTEWLGGVRITNVYSSPQMRGLRLP